MNLIIVILIILSIIAAIIALIADAKNNAKYLFTKNTYWGIAIYLLIFAILIKIVYVDKIK